MARRALQGNEIGDESMELSSDSAPAYDYDDPVVSEYENFDVDEEDIDAKCDNIHAPVD